MEEYVDFAKSMALEFGKLIYESYHASSFSYETKESAADLVSTIDKEVEDKTRQRILSRYPSHLFIAEESVSSGSPCKLTSAPTWILDPIDGTTNFINKFPYCCYSLAFFINEKTEVGVVYNPILNDMFYAVRGGGAFLNDQPIKVSSTCDIRNSLIMTDWGNDRVHEKISLKTENIKNTILHCRGIRSMGSAALHMCFVASGACEAFFEFGIHCWDIAAGRLIVEEAGGTCTMIDGSPIQIMKRQVLACNNAKLIPQILPLLKHVPYPSDD